MLGCFSIFCQACECVEQVFTDEYNFMSLSGQINTYRNPQNRIQLKFKVSLVDKKWKMFLFYFFLFIALTRFTPIVSSLSSSVSSIIGRNCFNKLGSFRSVSRTLFFLSKVSSSSEETEVWLKIPILECLTFIPYPKTATNIYFR